MTRGWTPQHAKMKEESCADGRRRLPAEPRGASAHVRCRGDICQRVAEAGVNADEDVEVGVVDVRLVPALAVTRRMNSTGDGDYLCEMTWVQAVGDEAQASMWSDFKKNEDEFVTVGCTLLLDTTTSTAREAAMVMVRTE